VAGLVRRHGLQDRVFFSSFLHFELVRAQKLISQVPRGQLTMRGWMGWWGRTLSWHAGVDALNPFHSDASAGLVERVHAAGKRVYVWTVNAEEDIKRMLDLGVDGIITDDPGFALRLLGRPG